MNTVESSIHSRIAALELQLEGAPPDAPADVRGELAWRLWRLDRRRASAMADRFVSADGPPPDDPAMGWACLTRAATFAVVGAPKAASDWNAAAAAAFESTANGPGRAAALSQRAELLVKSGSPDAAESAAREAEELARELDDWATVADARIALVRALVECRRPHEARQELDALLAEGDREHRPQARMQAHAELGALLGQAGEYPAASAHLEQALGLAEHLGDRVIAAGVHNNLGGVLRAVEDYRGMARHLGHALDVLQDVGHWVGVRLVSRNLSEVHAALGNVDEALDLAQDALDRTPPEASPFERGSGHMHVGRALGLTGDIEGARSHFGAAVDLLREASSRTREAIALTTWADVENIHGDPARGLEYAERAAELARETGTLQQQADALGCAGRSLMRLGDYDGARDRLVAGLAVIETAPRGSDGFALRTLSSVHAALGSFEEAHATLVRAEARDHELRDRREEIERARLRVRLQLEHAERRAVLERERNDELTRANAYLERLDREREELFHVVVHDLRNPLHSVILGSEMIEHALRVEDPRNALLATRILSAAQHMDGILSGLMDAARLEQGVVEFSPDDVDLAAEATACIERHSAAALAKTLGVDTQLAAARARADHGGVAKVLDNLLSNAIKFSHPQARIEVRCGTDGDDVFVEVADQGPGIPRADRDRLFGKFERLTARPTAGEASTGLGLYIVRMLVEAMGGTVGCVSAVGEGACFRVTLPPAV